MNKVWQGLTNLVSKCVLAGNSMNLINSFTSPYWIPQRNLPTLLRIHQKNLEWEKNPKIKKKTRPLDGKPYAKGIILKNIIKKPRKPNSANRKCVLVRLSTGKEMVAYVPGIGHNLQEHQTVLCRVGRLKDTPGVKIKCVRGKYDLPHVKPKK